MTNEYEDKRQAYQFIRTLIRSQKRLIALTLGLSLAAGLFEGGTIGILFVALKALTGDYTVTQFPLDSLGRFVDLSQDTWPPSRLFLFLIILAVVIQLIRSGLEIGNRISSLHLKARIHTDIYLRIVNQIMALSYARVTRYRTGELTTYISHGRDISTFLQSVSQVFISLIYISVYFSLLFWLSFQMTLITSVLILLVFVSTWHIVVRVKHLATEHATSLKNLNAQVVEYIQGIRLIHLLVTQKHVMHRVQTSFLETILSRLKSNRLQGISGPLMESVAIAGLAAMLIVIFWTTQNQLEELLPNVLAFLFILWRLILRNIKLRQIQIRLNHITPFINQIQAFLHPRDSSELFTDGQRPFKQLQHGIIFKDVTFQYDESEQPAIANLSFEIPRGSMVALVGTSGAGKTTVANLLLRLYDPTQGNILLDGIDLRDLQVGQWRNRIGVVNQDEMFFNLSVRENITFGLTDIEDSKIVEAARIAQAHDFIEQMPAGYDTVIGEKGYRLSGGQRQRIAMARSLIRDPDIFVLDEATSNLDSHSERLIQDAFSHIRQDHTMLVVAHRLSTVKQADYILVLDHGRLAEEGTHEVLLEKNGIYAHLWYLQSGTISPTDSFTDR